MNPLVVALNSLKSWRRQAGLGLSALPALLLVTASGCDKERSESIKLVNEAVKKEQLGDREVSYALYVRAAGIDPTNHRALFQMAVIELFDRNQPDKALEHLLAAEKLDGKDRDVLYQLGRFYTVAAKPDPDKALGYLARALVEDPNYAPGHYYRGVALALKDDAAGADKAFREAIACDPKYAPAWRDLGELYEKYDQPEAAEAVYQKALEHADEKGDILNALGMLKMQADRPKEAIKLFEQAMVESGDRTDTIFNLAFAFVAANDTKSAFRYLGEYINRSGPENAENIKVANLLRNAMLDELQKERNKAPEEPPK